MIIHYLKDKAPAALSDWVTKPRCFPPWTFPWFPSWPFFSSLAAEHKLMTFRNSVAGCTAASPWGGAVQNAPHCLSATGPWMKVTSSRSWKAVVPSPATQGLWWTSLWLQGGSGGKGHFKQLQLHLQQAASSCLRHHLLELWLVLFRAKAAMVFPPPKCGFSLSEWTDITILDVAWMEMVYFKLSASY